MLRLEGGKIDNGGFHLQAEFSVGLGRFVAVIGPSGGGKSTLLEAVAGFLPLSAGRLLWKGKDITHATPGQRPVAMLFQDGNLFPHLTAAQNVGLGLNPSLKLDAEDHQQVRAALDSVGLADLDERKPAMLSGGQQARVALARLTVQNRDLILLDEPFAALGPALKAEMLLLVAGLAESRGATVLMVSHDPEDAAQVASDVILVADGRAAPPVATQTIFDNPPEALRDYLGRV